MHRPKTPGNENIVTPVRRPANRLYASAGPDTLSKLVKPFKTPGSAPSVRVTALPRRKRRKVGSYAGADGEDDGAFLVDGEPKRVVLGNLEIQKNFPVFKAKDKDTVFRQRFAVPLVNKDAGGWNPSRPAPALGMRKSVNFIAKPLHDPSGEFAIVLYDPTIDDKKIEIIEEGGETRIEEKPAPKMHKSLADILGLNKDIKEDAPKVPVVIDPRLSKVLRPHQVEGVKVYFALPNSVSWH